MPKYRIFIGTVLLGALAGAHAVDYSNLYIFGDSLSDSGAYARIVGPGARFTTRPGNVWGENLGASYGRTITPVYAASLTPAGFSANTSGNNFAVGSARVNAQPEGTGSLAALAPFIPSVSTQVSAFLARGNVDSQALYALWAGGNDVFAYYNAAAGAVPSSTALNAMTSAAGDLAAEVSRLQSAGARRMIVLGLPDSSRFPYAANMTDVQREQVRVLNNSYNTALAAQMAGRNVLYFDTARLTATLMANPLAYGFSNITDPACGTTSALVCILPANGYLFADDKHPTTLFHKVVSDWIYGALEGASRIGLLSQAALNHSIAQWRSIDSRLQAFQNFGYQGQGVFVSGEQASAHHDATAGLPSAEESGKHLLLGYEKSLGEQGFGSVTLAYGKAPLDLGNNQGAVQYDAWTLSAFASHKSGAFYANALASHSWLSYQSRRDVILSTFSGSERGDTRGSLLGAKGQVGYNFVSGQLVHGPLLGLSWQRTQVNAFSEGSNSITAMSFGEQKRESLRSRLGWQLATSTQWSNVSLRPYAQLTYDYEHKSDERNYSAGFVGGTSRIDMPTANRTGGYGTLLAGVNAEISRNTHLGIGASTTISQPGVRTLAINMTLGVAF